MDNRFSEIRAVLEEIQEWARASKNDSEYVLPQLELLNDIERDLMASYKESEYLKQMYEKRIRSQSEVHHRNIAMMENRMKYISDAFTQLEMQYPIQIVVKGKPI